MNTGTYTFIGLVVVAIIVFALVKRRKRPPKFEGAAVPIHDPEEIKEFKKSMKPPKPPKGHKSSKSRPLPFGKMTNSQLMQMVREQEGIAPAPADFLMPARESEAKPAQVEIPPVKEIAVEEETPPPSITPTVAEPVRDFSQDRVESLLTENKQLKEALEREEEKPAETSATGLDEGQLKQLIQQEQERFEELDRKFSAFKTEYEHQKTLAATKEEVLENQIQQVKEENEKLLQLKGQVESTEAELNALRFYKKETEDGIRHLEQEVQEAKRANHELQPQLKEAQSQAAKAAQELQFLKVEHEQQVNSLTDKIMGLQHAVDNPPKPTIDEASQQALEQMRTKNEELMKVNQQLSHELDKLKEYTAQFREKEKILQYELTKARAQSVGLEKICEDFKIHIEKLSKVGP